jgi:phospholipase C
MTPMAASVKRLCLVACGAVCAWILAGCPQSSATADGGAKDGGITDAGDGGSNADAGPTDAGLRDSGTPFQYVFVLVKENHTFDNLYGAFPGANGAATAPLSDGGVVTLQPLDAGPLPGGPNHSHAAALTAWANGGMNGFDLIQQGGGAPSWLPFTQYVEADIPNYYAYASHYALCDNFFTLTLADSFPGYVGLISASSIAIEDPVCGTCNWGCNAPAGTTVQVYDPQSCAVSNAFPCITAPTIVDQLPAGLTWRTYGSVFAGTQPDSSFSAFQPLYGSGTIPSHTRDNSQLLSDLALGITANLTFIWGGNQSEHPPADICLGENDTVQIANALMSSPIWSQTLLIVTYDDWGGFYDHVLPPGAPCSDGEQFTPGFRVPTLLISAYSRPGPFHELATQASVDTLIEAIFGMPPLSNSNPRAKDTGPAVLLDAFDFTQPPQAGLQLSTRNCP